MDTYKVSTVANSESTMHTIMKSEFTIDMFSSDEGFYNDDLLKVQGMSALVQDIFLLNVLRRHWLEETDQDRKKMIWRAIIQKLPSAYMQKRTWTGNYRILRSIDQQRENHRLSEWNTFRDTCRELPYAEDLIFYKGEHK